MGKERRGRLVWTGFFGLNTYVCRKEICIAKSSVQKGYSNNHIFEMWSSLPSVLSAPRVSTAGEGLMCNNDPP
jgi:hypothetical protein